MLTREELTDIAKGLETLRQSNKSDLRESQVYSLTSYNKSVANINKHFFIIATILISAFAALASIEEIRNKLDAINKTLVVEILLLILFSLVFGFMHMFEDAKFYKGWLENVESRLKTWSSSSFWPSDPQKSKDYVAEYTAKQKETDNIQKRAKTHSAMWPIKMQAFLLFLSIVLTVALIVRLIY